MEALLAYVWPPTIRYPTSSGFLSFFFCIPAQFLAQRDIVIENTALAFVYLGTIVSASCVTRLLFIVLVGKSLVRIPWLQIEACFEAFRAGCKDCEFPTGVFKLHETCSSTHFVDRHHPTSLHTPSCWCLKYGFDGDSFTCKGTGSDTASFTSDVGCSKLVYST